ncbi:helix-turn-helix domain-containing protein [Nonomuraea sp. 10N515B]|uniref:helix-turn-helix domain-containing protein n=1 Tax=Nonomuraea sp. 10N515B TaxID=3457422 RepID=UPI003FCCA7DC
MSERPEAPPEGQLIAAALKRKRLSAREAARRTGISEGRWRQIVSGYQTVSGVHVSVRGPAETVARMAHIAGLSPTQLVEANRSDAADELREILQAPDAEHHGGRQVNDEMTDRERQSLRLLEMRVAAQERELAELRQKLAELDKRTSR